MAKSDPHNYSKLPKQTSRRGVPGYRYQDPDYQANHPLADQSKARSSTPENKARKSSSNK